MSYKIFSTSKPPKIIYDKIFSSLLVEKIKITNTLQLPLYTTDNIPDYKTVPVGSLIFDTSINKIRVNTGTTWETVTSG